MYQQLQHLESPFYLSTASDIIGNTPHPDSHKYSDGGSVVHRRGVLQKHHWLDKEVFPWFFGSQRQCSAYLSVVSYTSLAVADRNVSCACRRIAQLAGVADPIIVFIFTCFSWRTSWLGSNVESFTCNVAPVLIQARPIWERAGRWINPSSRIAKSRLNSVSRNHIPALMLIVSW